METRRWVNPSQPQTLYLGTILLYLSAAFGLLFGALFSPLGILIAAGEVAGGYGIANEKKWGYVLGVAMAALGLLPFILFAADEGVAELLDVRIMISMVFPVALFALLIHPQSREYQKVWFS